MLIVMKTMQCGRQGLLKIRRDFLSIGIYMFRRTRVAGLVINARPSHSTVSLFSISLTPLTETRSVWLAFATLTRAVTYSHLLSIKYFPFVLSFL